MQTVYRAPRTASGAIDQSARLIADGNPALAQIWSDRGPILKRGPWDKIPRELIEFSVKAEYAYDYGMPQWLARSDALVSGLHLERLFLGRHKFYHFRIWYRDALAAYLQDILLDSRSLSRPYVDRRTLQGMVGGHIKGQRNYTLEIHKALALELAHRQFVDRP